MPINVMASLAIILSLKQKNITGFLLSCARLNIWDWGTREMQEHRFVGWKQLNQQRVRWKNGLKYTGMMERRWEGNRGSEKDWDYMSCWLCISAMCSPPCAHGGTCMRWNKCLCRPGWTGEGCHAGTSPLTWTVTKTSFHLNISFIWWVLLTS